MRIRDRYGGVKIIEGKKIQLRVLELEDAKEMKKHWNDLEVRQFVDMVEPCSLEAEEEFIRNGWKGTKEKKGFTFGIELKSKKLLIGTITLRKIDWINRTAELGISLFNKSYWGRGLGTEATKLMLDYGFSWLNLHHIWLAVLDFNARAVKCYEKVGFKETGKFRKQIYKKGEYHDSLVMDILQEEWK